MSRTHLSKSTVFYLYWCKLFRNSIG